MRHYGPCGSVGWRQARSEHQAYADYAEFLGRQGCSNDIGVVRAS